MAQVLMTAIIAKVAVAAPNERFPNPDSVYIDLYDLDQGQSCQLTCRAGDQSKAHALVANLQQWAKQQVVLTGHMSIRNRQGGGSLVNIEPEFEVLSLAEWEQRQQARRKS